jgi:hypothetical protein
MTSTKSSGPYANASDAKVDPVTAHVLLLDGSFKHPNGEVMTKVKEILGKAGREVEAVIKAAPDHHTGALIRAIQLLVQAKDTACQALLLPYVHTDPRLVTTTPTSIAMTD